MACSILAIYNDETLANSITKRARGRPYKNIVHEAALNMKYEVRENLCTFLVRRSRLWLWKVGERLRLLLWIWFTSESIKMKRRTIWDLTHPFNFDFIVPFFFLSFYSFSSSDPNSIFRQGSNKSYIVRMQESMLQNIHTRCSSVDQLT